MKWRVVRRSAIRQHWFNFRGLVLAWSMAVGGSSSFSTRANPTGETVSNAPPEVIHPALRDSESLFPTSNLVTVAHAPKQVEIPAYQTLLQEALREKAAKNRAEAEKLFVRVLQSPATPEVYKTALLELAVLAQEGSDLVRAQQIYAQFLRDFQGDRSVPEVLLRQGLLYREMGAPIMAISKFYAVMSSALNLKLERLDYYQRLVLRAQSEIADTFYLQGKHEEATEFFNRLLKLDSPELDRPQILSKLIRCFSARSAYNEVILNSRMFLDRYPDAAPAPEVRYLLSTALKKLGRKDEAMQEVLLLLQKQKQNSGEDPQTWIYWRQRTGNDIANQFYQEADFGNALQIYLGLAALSSAAEWQLPALYQAGLVYERLGQSEKALVAYSQIVERRPEGTNSVSPNLVAILDMAAWRKARINWQQHADDLSRRLLPPQSSTNSP